MKLCLAARGLRCSEFPGLAHFNESLQTQLHQGLIRQALGFGDLFEVNEQALGQAQADESRPRHGVHPNLGFHLLHLVVHRTVRRPEFLLLCLRFEFRDSLLLRLLRLLHCLYNILSLRPFIERALVFVHVSSADRTDDAQAFVLKHDEEIPPAIRPAEEIIPIFRSRLLGDLVTIGEALFHFLCCDVMALPNMAFVGFIPVELADVKFHVRVIPTFVLYIHIVYTIQKAGASAKLHKMQVAANCKLMFCTVQTERTVSSSKSKSPKSGDLRLFDFRRLDCSLWPRRWQK